MKKLLWVFLILVAVGIIAGAIIWNKPHAKVEDAPSITVSAKTLQQAYSTDEQKANVQYLNKAVEVTGDVTEATTNQDGGLMVVLNTGDPIAAVQCTMREKNISVAKGKTIVIKGFCSGYNSITGVSLTDCVLK